MGKKSDVDKLMALRLRPTRPLESSRYQEGDSQVRLLLVVPSDLRGRGDDRIYNIMNTS